MGHGSRMEDCGQVMDIVQRKSQQSFRGWGRLRNKFGLREIEDSRITKNIYMNFRFENKISFPQFRKQATWQLHIYNYTRENSKERYLREVIKPGWYLFILFHFYVE